MEPRTCQDNSKSTSGGFASHGAAVRADERGGGLIREIQKANRRKQLPEPLYGQRD